MSKQIKRKFKTNKFLSLILIISAVYLIYNILLLGPIEKMIRYLIIGIIALIDLLIILKSFSKKSGGTALSIIIILIVIFNFIAGGAVNKIYSSLATVSKNKTVYSSSLVTLKNSNIKSIDSIKNKKICIIKDTTSEEGYIIPEGMIKDYKLSKDNKIIKKEDEGADTMNQKLKKKIIQIYLMAYTIKNVMQFFYQQIIIICSLVLKNTKK